MDQIEKYKPPPNFAKVTDSRAAAYIKEFGNDSWELDALEPSVLVELIRANVEGLRDEKKWKAAVKREAEERTVLTATSDKWDPVSAHIRRKYLSTQTRPRTRRARKQVTHRKAVNQKPAARKKTPRKR